MSFKIYNAATVGGNIVMSLPAGAMISLAASLEGVYPLWPRGGNPRKVSALDFVTGNRMNVLQPGELVRSIHLPVEALTKRFASAAPLSPISGGRPRSSSARAAPQRVTSR